jgi:hypothetical protein
MWMRFEVDGLLSLMIALGVVDLFLAGATSLWIEVSVL